LEQDFLEPLNGSSLDRIELIMAIEEVLGDYVPPEDERKIRSLRSVPEATDHIRKRRRDGGLN
jgi:acyl carrier protein